jgi:hypothetical protein
VQAHLALTRTASVVGKAQGPRPSGEAQGPRPSGECCGPV